MWLKERSHHSRVSVQLAVGKPSVVGPAHTLTSHFPSPPYLQGRATTFPELPASSWNDFLSSESQSHELVIASP